MDDVAIIDPNMPSMDLWPSVWVVWCCQPVCLQNTTVSGEWKKSNNRIHPACGLLRLLGLIIWFWYIFMMVMMLMWPGWPSKLSPNSRVNNPETSSSKQNKMTPLAVSCHQCWIYFTTPWFGTGRPRCLMERFTKSIASCTANPVNAASAQCMARLRLLVAINQHLKIRLKADTWLSSSVYVYIYIISILLYSYLFMCTVCHSASEIRTMDKSSQGIANSKSTVRSTLWDVPSIMGTLLAMGRLAWSLTSSCKYCAPMTQEPVVSSIKPRSFPTIGEQIGLTNLGQHSSLHEK